MFVYMRVCMCVYACPCDDILRAQNQCIQISEYEHKYIQACIHTGMYTYAYKAHIHAYTYVHKCTHNHDLFSAPGKHHAITYEMTQ